MFAVVAVVVVVASDCSISSALKHVTRAACRLRSLQCSLNVCLRSSEVSACLCSPAIWFTHLQRAGASKPAVCASVGVQPGRRNVCRARDTQAAAMCEGRNLRGTVELSASSAR